MMTEPSPNPGQPLPDAQARRVAREMLLDLAAAPTPPLAEMPTVVAGEGAGATPARRVGPYLIIGLLGRGGMGAVYRARDTRLGREVALKLFEAAEGPPAQTAERMERFHREATTLARLGKHPHVVQVHELGREGNTLYFSMDLVEGANLREWLSTPREPRDVVSMLHRVALGLGHAHAHGIVHRDVKPENVFLGPDDEPQVGDFGLVRDLAASQGLTEEGQVMGTYAYMAPEQASGRPELTGPWTDVHALGIMLYEALCGQRPFDGSPSELRASIERRDALPLRSHNARIEVDLEAVVMRCLEKEPGRRYPDAGALAADLGRWMEGEPVTATRLTPAYWFRKKLRRHRTRILAALGLGLLGAALAMGPGTYTTWQAARQRRQRAEDARSRVDRARELLARGDADGALREADLAQVLSQASPDEALPQAEAELLKGMALARKGTTGRAEVAWASAYRIGAVSLRAPEREAAARALLELARSLQARGDLDHARGAFRALLGRFPSSPLASEARFGLACAEEGTGRLDAALSHFESVSIDDALSPADRARTRESISVLRSLLPMNDQPLPEGETATGDVDGDGRSDLVMNEASGRVSAWRAEGGRLVRFAETPIERHPSGHVSRIFVADADGRPGNEVLATWGMAERDEGEVRVWRLDGADFVPGPRAEIGTTPEAIVVADLDRDGRREVLVATGPYLRRLLVLHLEGDSLKRIASRAFEEAKGVDVLALRVGEFDPADGLEVLASLGPGSGYRMVLLRWDGATSDFTEIARSSWRSQARSVWGLPDGRLLFASWQDEAARAEVQAGAATADVLPTGAFVLTVSPSLRLGPPERVAGNRALVFEARPVRLANEAWVLRTERPGRPGSSDRIVLVRAPGSDGPLRKLREGPVRIWAADDLDGDGDDEVLLHWTEAGGARFATLGLGEKPVAAAPGGAFATDTSVGEDLLSLGQTDEAERDFRLRHDEIGLARVSMERRELRAALDHLSKEGIRRTEALRLSARCLEELGAWGPLLKALEELSETASLDPIERDEVARHIEWVRRAASMETRDRLASDRIGVWSDSPFLASRKPDGLAFRQTTAGNYEAGVPFWYGGGPIRLTWRMRVPRIEWGTFVRIGVSGSLSMALSMRAGGSGTEVTRTFSLASWARDGQLREFELSAEASGLEAGGEYDCALEYVPGADRIRLRVESGGRRAECEVAALGKLENGWCRFGKTCFTEAPQPGRHETDVEVEDVSIAAWDPLTRFGAPPVETARDCLMTACGAAVDGNAPEAIEGLAEAIRRSGPLDRRVAAQAGLFRAILLLRTGDLDQARADLAEARALDKAAVDEAILVSAPALSAEEIEFCEPK